MPYKDKDKQKAAQRRYYEENKSDIYARQRERRNLKLRYIQDIKENTPCTDCGIQYPYYIMEFDHIPGRGDKLGCISGKYLNDVFSNMNALKAEIAKCELVCANCHKHRTWKRLRKLKEDC